MSKQNKRPSAGLVFKCLNTEVVEKFGDFKIVGTGKTLVKTKNTEVNVFIFIGVPRKQI